MLKQVNATETIMPDATKAVAIPQIEKLRGDLNHHQKRSMAVTFLDTIGICNVVNGMFPKPEAKETYDLVSWQCLSHGPKRFLLLNVEKAPLSLVSSSANTPTA
jgi:hypothetical protein